MDVKQERKRNIIIGLVLAVGSFAIIQGLIMAGVIRSYQMVTVATICINIILAAGLNLVTGFTGQFSLGHAGFMAIGAYVCAIFTLSNNSMGNFFLGTLLGAILAAVFGVLIGIPTLRLKGDYLAIATLGFAEIIRIFAQNMTITGGAAGLSGIPKMTSWPMLWAFTVGTLVLILAFIKSSHGRACIAIREDEIAAESMGVNTTKYKVMAFAIGAFFAGIGGALYASTFYILKPTTFGFMKSIEILMIVVLGGMGSMTGTVVASAVLAVITMLLQSFSELRMVLYAIMLVAIMLFRPQGLMGSRELSIPGFTAKRQKKAPKEK
ncbi:MAG: branched-chain amino acid ABC transporter permease [Firmicutes bacterium]|nr:branched-chain amino acid ABC transporter permease [Bacillota bacterium]MBQ2270845.1 branched-chain amino acid ABC transporter permease [Bacillota bacterium]